MCAKHFYSPNMYIHTEYLNIGNTVMIIIPRMCLQNTFANLCMTLKYVWLRASTNLTASKLFV